jgi:hypothetical protein
MEQQIYHFTLILTGLANIAMALWLQRDNHSYTDYPVYQRARILTMVWLIAFGIGYLIHAVFQLRTVWPTAASALSVTYFHIGALCFSWGYTSLLQPDYLSRKVVVRDLVIIIFALIVYWTVPFFHPYAPLYTLFSFCIFFSHAVFIAFKFYRVYARISFRLIKLSFGSVSGFVKWMQVCCDLIVMFGLVSVAITAIFPTDMWPFTLLLLTGTGMFGYIAYSLNKYGLVIDAATHATTSVCSPRDILYES